MTGQMIKVLTICDLPEAYYISIGNVIVRWAHLEWRLRETLYVTLNVNPKQGRLAVASPRAHEILTRIEDLMTLDGITTSADLKKLRRLVNEAGVVRNDLAHGIWIDHPEESEPSLQKVSGEYAPEEGAPKIKARINPQAMSITPAEMNVVAHNIDRAIEAINVMKDEIKAQLAASRKKSRAQSDANS